MAHDVRIAERDVTKSFDPFQPRDRIDQAAAGVGGQVDLRRIARDDHLRAQAHPRQKHLHLRHGRVLRFVQNHEGFVQRPPAHVGQRDHLDQVLLGVALDLFVVHHLAQRVEQRTQIGIDLGLQVAGQKAQAFARLDRRPHQHDLADRLLLQRLHGHRHGQIRFARPGRPGAKHQIVLLDRLDVAGLATGARTDRAAGVLQVFQRRRARRPFRPAPGPAPRRLRRRPASLAA